jgi:hypothetical protein
LCEDRVVRKIFGPKEEKLSWDWRSSHDEKQYDFLLLTRYHTVIKSGKLNGRGMVQVGMRGEAHTEFWWRILR